MIGSRIIADAEIQRKIRGDPLLSKELNNNTQYLLSSTGTLKKGFPSQQQTKGTVPVYQASLDLLLKGNKDELIQKEPPMTKEDDEEYENEINTVLASRSSLPDSSYLSLPQQQQQFLPPSSSSSISSTTRRRPSYTTLTKAIPNELPNILNVPGSDTLNGSKARYSALQRSHNRLMNTLVDNIEYRRTLWTQRYENIGEFWYKKLRHCGWRQSLRMAFEVPALHSAKHAEMGHQIPRDQFMAACHYAITLNPNVVTTTEMDNFLELCYNSFDIEGKGTLDYREFLCTLLFFRIPPENATENLIYTWYRYYDGDVTGGLKYADFLQMMTTLCVTPEEANKVIRLMNVKSLEQSPDVLNEGNEKTRVVNGRIILGTNSNQLNSSSSLQLARSQTLQNLPGHEAQAMAVASLATRADARAMGIDSRVNTADIIHGTHAELMYLDDVSPGIQGSRYPFSKRQLYVVPRTPDEVVQERTRNDIALTRSFSSKIEKDIWASDEEKNGNIPTIDETNEEDYNDEEQMDEEEDDGDDFVDDRSEGEKQQDAELDMRQLMDGKNTQQQSRRADDLWTKTLGKSKRHRELERLLKAAQQEEDDPDAPWNRGKGTLTEVRVIRRRKLASRSILFGDSTRSSIQKEHMLNKPRNLSPNQGSKNNERIIPSRSNSPTQQQIFRSPGVPHTMVTLKTVPGVNSHIVPYNQLRPPTVDSGNATLMNADNRTGTDDVIQFDPLRGELGLVRRNTEAVPTGPLIIPINVKKITINMIKFLLQMSPGLADEIHRLRILRLPTILRSAYMSRQMDKQVKLAHQRYERLREDLQTRRALALWRQKQLNTHFGRWKSYIRFLVWERVKINSMRARRMVRIWYTVSKDANVWRAKVALADAHYLQHITISTFRQWTLAHQVTVRTNATKWRQALTFHRHAVLERTFQALLDRAKLMRARKHYAARLVMKCLQGWVEATNLWKKDRAATDLAAKVAEERIKRTQEEIERQDREREAAEAAAAEAAAYAEFMREAERTKEEQRLTKMREDADRKLQDNRITKMQLEAREVNYHLRKEAFRQAFEEEWAEKIRLAVLEARAEATLYCLKERDAMREDAKTLLMGETVQAVTQEESDFRALFDMSDGCIHFIRDADPTVDPPIERIDLNMDSMRLKDAIMVASAHYVAKCGCRMRAEKLQDKERAWKTAVSNEASRVFQRRWAAKQSRRQFLNELRTSIEQFIDPQTGSIYYYNIQTGKTFDTKPVMFRGDDVHPLPDYYLKWDPTVSSNPNDPTAPITGAYVYAHRKIPWKVLREPPPGYLLCYMCGVDFATRRCEEYGCYGYAYCWNCFSSYHPYEDKQWRDHWTKAQRITVKALNKTEAQTELIRAAEATAAMKAAAEGKTYVKSSGLPAPLSPTGKSAYHGTTGSKHSSSDEESGTGSQQPKPKRDKSKKSSKSTRSDGSSDHDSRSSDSGQDSGKHSNNKNSGTQPSAGGQQQTSQKRTTDKWGRTTNTTNTSSTESSSDDDNKTKNGSNGGPNKTGKTPNTPKSSNATPKSGVSRQKSSRKL